MSFMEWLQRIYENAMSNMDRRVGAFEDPANQWGMIIAILGAIGAAFAVHYMLRKNKRDKDQDSGRGDDDAKW